VKTAPGGANSGAAAGANPGAAAGANPGASVGAEMGGSAGDELDVALYGHPTAAELLEAARGFLADEVLAATEGSVQFHTRVTIRVLDTVARQLRLQAGYAAAHTARLADLGRATDRELVAAIRAGAYDTAIEDLAAALEPDVRAKLEVWNPRYMD
jgi:hypothetical protein